MDISHIPWKTMLLDSEKCWQAYKESVLTAQNKYFELFPTKKVGSWVHIDLNQHASPSGASSPIQHDEPCVDLEPEMYDTKMS